MTKAIRISSLMVILALSISSCYNEDNRIPITCTDGIQNQEETGIDCGGPCEPCPPTCFNGILDWDEELEWFEAGVDCGGPCEASCCENGIQDINPNDSTLNESWVDCVFDNIPPGFAGSANEDCPICDNCSNGIHDPEEMFFGEPAIDCDDDPLTDCPPCSELCDDGLLNGLEAPCGIDCGGVCLSCQADVQCTNGIQDVFPDDPALSEIGVDCGGCACPECALLCFDGELNGTEEAIDCGGDFCVPCNDPSLCGDGIQNGYETGIDCYDGDDGLSACPSCAQLCNNNIQDGFETDVDCGGVDCGACSDNLEPDSELDYLIYEVDGVLFESQFASVQANRVPSVDNTVRDFLTVTGGVAHTMTITLEDGGPIQQFGQFGTQDITIFNSDFLDIQEVALLDGGITYSASNNNVGITVSVTAIQYQAPIPPAQPGGKVEGTFEGQLFDPLTGEFIQITNGEFRATFVD